MKINYGTESTQEPNKYLWCESENNQVVIGIDEVHNTAACNRITLDLNNRQDRKNLEKIISNLRLALGKSRGAKNEQIR